MSRTASAIALTDVRVRLAGADVLCGVSARIPRGCLVALVGPNGAGKSTLLRAASGQVPLHEGHIEVSGEPIHRLSRRQIARAVCLLPQNAGLAFALPSPQER